MLGRLVCLFAALLLSAGSALAQSKAILPLPVNGEIEPDGSAVHLNLADAKPPRVGNVIVKRRQLGQVGGKTWQVIAPQLGPVMRFTDRDVKPGIAYEYQVLRTAKDIVDAGYFTAGVKLPAIEARGTVLLVVDQSIASDISLRLDRFEQDLIGDGWHVTRHLTPRGSKGNYVESLEKAAELRGWIQEQYFSDPFARHALILVGHVPIALSGRSAPDGHEPVPHATDLFYAEMDGQWRLWRNQDGKALLGENRLPSDAIEMQVGRIDFASASAGDRNREISHLRAYFDKNHHWRQGMMGDLRDAYAQSEHLKVERAGLRNIVGKQQLTSGGHHDAGGDKPWLWGVDFGDHKPGRYASDHAIKATFVINFGSGKQKIERFGNALVATLAQPWHVVAAGWGGRPSWRLHHMALGKSIGESHLRTVNNGSAQAPPHESMDYFPTGGYLWRNPIWVNLLGDPTLRAFMLAPPTQARATRDGDDINLSWTPSSSNAVLGYKIYRADDAEKDFQPVDGAELITGTTFTDRDAPDMARYMIRSFGLQNVHAGSFYAYSQGAFAEIGAQPIHADDHQIDATAGQAVELDLKSTFEAENVTEAFIHAPDRGVLQQVEGKWLFTPASDATGQINIPYSRSNRQSTDVGNWVVSVIN